MMIRKYQEKDCKELAKLFYDTVHFVNCKDYTKAVSYTHLRAHET